MLNIYDLTQQEVANVLQGIPTDEHCLPVFVLDYPKAQYLIDLHIKKRDAIPNLLPVQFYYLLGKTGLDKAINIYLDELHEVDVNKYAMYKGYLNGARHFEFSKAYAMYIDIKSHLLTINADLDFSIEQLKTLWKESQMV